MGQVDTQGWEYKVLLGATKALAARRFLYVQYEFSPWLMLRSSTGDPGALARLLPSLEASALKLSLARGQSTLPRPSTPIGAYVDRLNSGKHSEVYPSGIRKNDANGHWDDITYAFLGDGQ